MLTVSLPHSQTNRSPPAIDDRSPWQTGQWVFFEISTVVKSMSLKSQTISLFFNVEPTHAKIFIVSIVWRAPIIPVVAPRTPRVLHVNKSESERFGIKHSKQPVSGGAKTDRLPSMPIAAPKTYGVPSFMHARLTRYRVTILSNPSTTTSTPLRSRSTSVSYTHLRAHETDSYLVCR